VEKENKKSKLKFGILKRILSPVTFVSEILIDGAVKEISAVVKKYVIVGVNFLLSLLFFFFFWLSFNVLFVFGLNKFFGLDYFLSVLIIMSVNLVCSIVFFLMAKSKLNQK